MLSAPNRFIRDFVVDKYVPMINSYLLDVAAPASAQVSVVVAAGSSMPGAPVTAVHPARHVQIGAATQPAATSDRPPLPTPSTPLIDRRQLRCCLHPIWLRAIPSSGLSRARATSWH